MCVQYEKKIFLLCRLKINHALEEQKHTFILGSMDSTVANSYINLRVTPLTFTPSYINPKVAPPHSQILVHQSKVDTPSNASR